MEPVSGETKVFEELKKQIHEGNAQAAPYELNGSTGCDYCAYHGICGFDPRLDGYAYRSLENYSKEEVMEGLNKLIEAQK